MHRILFSAIVFNLILANISEAQNKEWVEKDVENIKKFVQIYSPENTDLSDLNSAWKNISDNSIFIDLKRKVGFNAKLFNLTIPGGYNSIRGTFLVYDGSIAKSEIIISLDNSNKVDSLILQTWKINDGPSYEIENSYLISAYQNEEHYSNFKSEITQYLGEQKDIDIPDEFLHSYNFLMNPMNSLDIGDVCYFSGIVPKGMKAIRELAKNKQWEIITQILRGYNPEGRIYAAIALTNAKQRGLNLSEDTQATISKVMNLDIAIQRCDGCIISDDSPQNVIKDFRVIK